MSACIAEGIFTLEEDTELDLFGDSSASFALAYEIEIDAPTDEEMGDIPESFLASLAQFDVGQLEDFND